MLEFVWFCFSVLGVGVVVLVLLFTAIYAIAVFLLLFPEPSVIAESIKKKFRGAADDNT